MRFPVNSLIAGRYIVERIVTEGRVFQLVHAKDVLDGDHKVVRVINRSTVAENRVLSDLAWLKHNRTADDRHAEFYADHRDILYIYLVFKHPKRTLKDILSDDKLYLTARHVREISRQVLRAVHVLHAEFIIHTDISPANVEIIDTSNVTESVYCEDGTFSERLVLMSTKIRLCFYGDVGLRSATIVGEDQYRSPEAVFHMRLREESDTFSLGCMICELVTRFALFPKCSPGPSYRREKAILFDAVLGPFPDELIDRIRSQYTNIFRNSTSDAPEIDSGVCRSVRRFADGALPLRALINDKDALDLVELMVNLDYRCRVPLIDLDSHPFFKVRD